MKLTCSSLRKRNASVVALAILMIGAACSSGEETTRFEFDFEYEQLYDLNSLQQDADLVVLGTASEDRSVDSSLPGFPYTIVEFRVSSVVNDTTGLDLPDMIEIRQIGGTSDHHVAVMRADTEYLLFLDQFEYNRGEPTGQFIPLGANQGVYQATESGRFESALVERPSSNPSELAVVDGTVTVPAVAADDAPES